MRGRVGVGAALRYPVDRLQRLFVKEAGGDLVRRQGGIMAERTAGPETASLVEADRRRLIGACLKPQNRLPGVARRPLDPGEKRLPDAAPARRLAGVHALHLGVAVEQGDRAAAGGVI